MILKEHTGFTLSRQQIFYLAQGRALMKMENFSQLIKQIARLAA
jgi:hypothetical protein